MKWQPKPYQEKALDFAMKHKRAALWLEMGLGKTSVAATMVAELMDQLRVNRTLVVAPKRVCESVWPAELAKWDHLKHIPIRFVTGSQRERTRMLRSPWHGIECITYETLAWTADLFGTQRMPYQLVIFDESSKMKSSSTNRFKRLRAYMRRHDLPFRVLELTGSPAPQGLLGVWAPIFILDEGQRLGRRFPDYRERFFESDYMGWKYTPRRGAVDRIGKRIEDITMSMRAADYLDLPELVTNDIWVDMAEDHRRIYRELEQEMFLQLRGGTVEAINAGVLTGKCRQFAQGSMYLNGRRDEWGDIHSLKLDALKDIVEELEGNPLLVCYQFRFDKERLREAFPKAVFYDEVANPVGAENRWRDGHIPMLCIHPGSAGHGLNLQGVCTTLAMYGCPWSFDQYDQTVARIAGGLRRTQHTIVHRISTRDTVDADVLTSLDGHRQLQDVLKDRLKRAA